MTNSVCVTGGGGRGSREEDAADSQHHSLLSTHFTMTTRTSVTL